MARRAADRPPDHGSRPTLAALAAALQAGVLSVADLARDPRAGARQLAAQWARRQVRAQAERARLRALFAHERAAWAAGLAPVAGLDEAGRGPLAGPVVAAAVVFSEEVAVPGLRDSKRLPPEGRLAVYERLLRCGAAVGIGVAGVDEIDRLNILGATALAWTRALAGLPATPALVLIDGHLRAPVTIAQRPIVKGDAQCASIAAASIVAKVTRDRLMRDLDQRFPQYGFARHKGYATAAHLAALRRHGPCPAHRRAFLPADLQQEALWPAPPAREGAR
ncbi:MAG: ribonuclease HII [Armatimonadota bacterium]|nr:ribonuclease HII [Armatimonadota bacterium]